jgi:high-affinity Fe2+/Pb2+ permease
MNDGFGLGTKIEGVIYGCLFFFGFILLLSEMDEQSFNLMTFIYSRIAGIIVLLVGYKGFTSNAWIKDWLDKD